MTVAELIEQLQKMPDKARVIVADPPFYTSTLTVHKLNNSIVRLIADKWEGGE